MKSDLFLHFTIEIHYFGCSLYSEKKFLPAPTEFLEFLPSTRPRRNFYAQKIPSTLSVQKIRAEMATLSWNFSTEFRHNFIPSGNKTWPNTDSSSVGQGKEITVFRTQGKGV